MPVTDFPVSRAPFVLGLDAGGTATRCVLSTLTGEIIGRGDGPGASTQSSADPAKSLRTAMSAALAGVDPGQVVAAVAGIAGAGSGRRPAALQALVTAADAVGLPEPPELVTDLETAYAAGTTEPTGLLMIAGTGAVAAWIVDGRIAHRADGWGWLVGDAGSALWQGRRAVEAALAALDGRGPATALVDAVRTTYDLGTEPGSGSDSGLAPLAVASAIVGAVYAVAPAELGRLAPAVGRLAATDQVAAGIVADASEALLRTAAAVLASAGLADGENPPAVVIGGSLLTGDGSVADATVKGLTERTGVIPQPVRDAELGAVTLALRKLNH